MVSGTAVAAFDDICKTVHHVAVRIFRFHPSRTFCVDIQTENRNRDSEAGHKRFRKKHLKDCDSRTYNHVDKDTRVFVTGDKIPAAEKQNDCGKCVDCLQVLD